MKNSQFSKRRMGHKSKDKKKIYIKESSTEISWTVQIKI